MALNVESSAGYPSAAEAVVEVDVVTAAASGEDFPCVLCPSSVPVQGAPPHLEYPFEALFRSQHYALLDNSCREYLFICEFFVVSGPAAHDLFHAVMGRTLAMTLGYHGQHPHDSEIVCLSP
ncbi:hypothetical protein A6R68_08747 [Neotoma lepida]|uniref:Vps52 C-terminal domain-containing protein n=1 Tax=Neotoma lepida TaxID=56216 RepID=A0A1A6G2U5_NEOLE|nr:hypothetical protein A6R68_08747 [Neotoma lepida]